MRFSEDPTITRFVPHTAATARQAEPYVWAVDAARAPDHWQALTTSTLGFSGIRLRNAR
ncbi:DUF6886 family protein [Nocardia grenadensis]|uniref:DUF6886 family protein n=1 Tax=Nocardia grenadensis TaxID=931537 RepID=UPI003D71E3CD